MAELGCKGFGTQAGLVIMHELGRVPAGVCNMLLPGPRPFASLLVCVWYPWSAAKPCIGCICRVLVSASCNRLRWLDMAARLLLLLLARLHSQRLAAASGAARRQCSTATVLRSLLSASFQQHPLGVSDRPAQTRTALQLQPTTPPEDVPFEAVLVRGEADASKPAPLIVYPHGGPHSAYPDGFFPTVAFLCHLGFSVLLVNFRSA